LSCPYFVPTEILADGSWLHPARLPLGAGWRGNCCASDEVFTPDETTLREFCNLGYAHGCPRLSADHDWDAIRFSVASASDDQVTLWYVCEAAHAPRQHGQLTCDVVQQAWLNPHPDARVQRLAACYLQTFQSRQPKSNQEPIP